MAPRRPRPDVRDRHQHDHDAQDHDHDRALEAPAARGARAGPWGAARRPGPARRSLAATALLAAVLAAVLMGAVDATYEAPGALWARLSTPHEDEHDATRRRWKNRSLQARMGDISRKTYVAMNVTTVIHLAEDAPTNETWSIKVDLPSGNETTCTMVDSRILPAALRRKYPTVRAWSGACEDGVETHINLETDRVDSLSATVRTRDGEMYYVDATEDGSNVYVMYNIKDARMSSSNSTIATDSDRPQDGSDAENSAFSCGTHGAPVIPDDDDDEDAAAANATDAPGDDRRRLLTEDGEVISAGYTFRMALIANKQYSAYHGNTITSVLNALAELLARVNGIYSRELGVYFALIDRGDELICIEGECDYDLPNDSSLINVNKAFIDSVGIDTTLYDIGHSLSTGAGGVATYPALCYTSNKARGTTGISNPTGDPFAVDYVSHEIGHQLMGGHSFRDCGSQIMTSSASEPGSGSTIMGYANLCSGRNLQSYSDPYLHPVNLQQMRDFIENRVAARSDCGQVFSSGQIRPVVSVVDDVCTVPVGNAFQLRGRAVNDAAKDSWFAWDRADTGAQTYSDTSLGDFRSYMPITSQSRFFPNMYYLVNDITTLAEHLPQQEMSMVMRFTARTSFSASLLQDDFSTDLIGDFGFADLGVDFTTSVGPLEFTQETKTALAAGVTPLQYQKFTWNVANTDSISPEVEILVAIDTIPAASSNFEYSTDTVDLDWWLVAKVENTGSANLKIPIMANNTMLTAHFMIRSSGQEHLDGDAGCYFFDMATRASMAAVVSTGPIVQGNVTTPTTGEATDGPTASDGDEAAGVSPIIFAAAGGGSAVALLAIAAFMYIRRPHRRSRGSAAAAADRDFTEPKPRPLNRFSSSRLFGKGPSDGSTGPPSLQMSASAVDMDPYAGYASSRPGGPALHHETSFRAEPASPRFNNRAPNLHTATSFHAEPASSPRFFNNRAPNLHTATSFHAEPAPSPRGLQSATSFHFGGAAPASRARGAYADDDVDVDPDTDEETPDPYDSGARAPEPARRPVMDLGRLSWFRRPPAPAAYDVEQPAAAAPRPYRPPQPGIPRGMPPRSGSSSPTWANNGPDGRRGLKPVASSSPRPGGHQQQFKRASIRDMASRFLPVRPSEVARSNSRNGAGADASALPSWARPSHGAGRDRPSSNESNSSRSAWAASRWPHGNE